MTDFGASNSTPDDAVIDLARFGFDDANDAWLHVFRNAQIVEPLGRVGEYELQAEIGRGGQGIVYRARRTRDDQHVAIKRLIGGKFATADLRRRFEREMQAIAALNHPNIARAIDVVDDDDQPVIVMEFIDGESLTTWARAHGNRRPIAEVIPLFVDVCDAVQHAHIRGVIHRDLKPSNVLVTTQRRGESRSYRPVVLDFGMARVLNGSDLPSNATTSGRFLGTLAYAAPEQLKGDLRPADALADIYALGVMLYEALAGRNPHLVAGSLGETVRSIQEKMPERLSASVPGVSRELEAIIFKALSKAPTDRYQSVDALAADLRRFLAGDPVMARAPGTLYLAGKLIRRHPVTFAVGLSIFALVSTLATALVVANAHEKAALRVAKTTSDFLAETLAAAEPDRSGADVTLLEVLAQAGNRAERELSGSPEAAAQVYIAIGKTYNSLWRWRDAIPHLEKATQLLRTLPDLDDDVLAKALTSLGRAYTSVRDPKARQIQEEALAIRRRLFDEPDARIAESLKELAYALQQATDPPQWDLAEACYEEAIAMYHATLGPDDRETASCLHNFGWMRVRQRRYADAVELYRQAIDTFRRTNRRDDPFYVECLFGYSAQLSVVGRDEENLDVINELVPRLRASHGESEIGDLLWAKAETLVQLGQFDAADDVYADAFTAFFDWCDIKTPSTDRDADALCDELIDHLPAMASDKTGPALSVVEAFAHSRIAASRFERAEAIFDRLNPGIDQWAPDAVLTRASILEGRAEIANAGGDPLLAQQWLSRALEIVDKPGFPFDRKRAWLERQLAVILSDPTTHQVDFQRLTEVYERLADVYGLDHRRTRETRQLIEKLRREIPPQ
ncbi:MAG: serine/threonine protein kinase [Phycisphaerales bacterium]|nr:serine/threonine protein kinase [Phycisphaerales bacterium]MCB9862184.1 serine/threonine protein kinase [Phycisphaerales bacterium]